MVRLPLDQLSDQIQFLLQEMTMTGRWLLPSLGKPMTALKSGRSPKALDLAGQLSEPEDWLRLLDEVQVELAKLLPELRIFFTDHQAKNPNSPDVVKLGKELPVLDQELAFWKAIADRSRALLKKLRLISEEEKLSPLARGPLQDSWEELSQLSK